MKAEFDIPERFGRLRGKRSYFDTFIDRPSLAAGVLVLQPGEEDTQEPHDADEVYYVVSGDGFLRIGKRDHAVSGGRMFLVPGGTEHFFHGNKRELKVVYFFGGQGQ